MKKELIINSLLDYLGRESPEEIAGKLNQLDIDEWQHLIEFSRQYGVTPLLYSHLKLLSPSIEIPPDISKKLRNVYLQSAGRNTLLYNQLNKLLGNFSKANISVILLKGAYLAEGVYGVIALRPMQDIDLLIKKEDISKAQEILKELGYLPAKPIHAEFDSSQHHHFPQFVCSGKIPIEIHWNISTPLAPFEIDPRELWQRTLTEEVGGYKVLVLCAEDLLLHIIIHLSYHNTFQASLLSLYDIKVVLEKFGAKINWDEFVQRAFNWKVERCVYLTLSMVQNLLAQKLPENIMAKLKPNDFSGKVISIAEEQLFYADLNNYEISSGLAHAWQAENLCERISLFFKRVFPSREELATKYPAPPWSLRIYLYYPVRIKDLFVRYGRGALGLVKKDEAALGLTKHRVKGEELRAWMEGEEKKQF